MTTITEDNAELRDAVRRNLQEKRDNLFIKLDELFEEIDHIKTEIKIITEKICEILNRRQK